MIKRVIAVYFSPAGSTRRLAEQMAASAAAALGAEYGTLDITLPEARSAGEKRAFSEEDLVVFGMPTYAGRLPNKISPFVGSGFSGAGAYAIALVTYGNRSFDSSLTELRYLLRNSGFKVIGEAAFPCVHAFTDLLAPGRPDKEDLSEAGKFAEKMAARIAEGAPAGDAAELPVVSADDIAPYYVPKKEDGSPAVFLKARPVTDPGKCDGCGICAGVCPMGSVDRTDPSKITGICIKCCACVRKCPKGAKYFDDPEFLSHVSMLERDYRERKEIYMFP